MSYNDRSELPKAVKALPAEAQVLWMRTYNQALLTLTAKAANQLAWTDFNRKWEKTGTTWTKKIAQTLERDSRNKK